MMLATRCPYCRTTFRVVQDQLKICNGIVRCGSCRQVFNGIEQLQSADAALHAAARAEAQEAASWPQNADTNPVTIVAEDEDKASFTEANEDLKLILTPAQEEQESAHTPLSETPNPVFADAHDEDPAQRRDEELEPDLRLHIDARDGFDPGDEITGDAQTREAIDDPHFVPTAMPAMIAAAREAALPPSVPEDDEPAYKVDLSSRAAEPAFVQRARRNERWGRTARIATVLLVLGLLPALMLQSVDAFHQRIAATFPAMKPALNQVCEVIDCQRELPAQIEAVSVDASELHAPKNSEKTFALNLVLRNRSALAQAWPYIELTLNDANEKPVARRVFKAPEYLGSAPDLSEGFAARSERSISLVFEVEQIKPVGYRVYLFYP